MKTEICGECGARLEPPAQPPTAMQIDHEDSRAAFEAASFPNLRDFLEKNDGGNYVRYETRVAWLAWCAALDYAAQQQQAPSEHVCALNMDMTGRCFVCGSVDGPRRAAFEADEERHKAEQQNAPNHEKAEAISGGICDFCGQDASALKVLNLAPAVGACYCKKCATDCEADAGWRKNQTEPAPAPLPRPDRPGWWWQWSETEHEWFIDHYDELDFRYSDGQERHWYADQRGLWLPATPPPAPNDKLTDCEPKAPRRNSETNL